MPLADFHCHLEHSDFDADRTEVVRRAQAAGVERAVTAGSSTGENRKIVSLCKEFPDFLLGVIGTSPHDASLLDERGLQEELSFVKSHLDSPGIVGIGEIGLDAHHFSKPSEHENQERCFRAYLGLAESECLPVVVHSRKAEERVFSILEEFPSVKVLLHCFFVHRLAARAVSRGWRISLPTVKSRERHKIAREIPLAQLACETDAPFLWKDPVTGKPSRNEPANVRESYEAVALARGVSLESVSSALRENFNQLFAAEKK